MISRTQKQPKHLGIIMDGNRRWAHQNGLPSLQGHRRGLDTFKDISLAAFERGIPYVSAYVFSSENWQRTQEEVSYLMGLVKKGIAKHLKTFDEANIRLVMLGSREGVDELVLEQIDQATKQTASNSRGTLALCFNYSGQEEIVQAARQVAQAGQAISEQSLAAALYEPTLPPLDLVIRTSGEQRLSGFMLWRAAYAELFFSQKMWPDFTAADLDQALADYSNRQRRFGS